MESVSVLTKALNKKWPFDVDKILFSHAVLIGLPTIFYYCLRLDGLPLMGIHMTIATAYLLSSLMLMAEATVAAFRRRAIKPSSQMATIDLGGRIKSALRIAGALHVSNSQPLPRCSFIVAAYLPNEQDIILETLHHLLSNIQSSKEGLEVILAYNSPTVLPVEAELQAFARQYPALILHRVNQSRSKAENINSALKIVTGELTCVLDADHHPAPDCFVRAWRWLQRGYDVVQGRNVIRNAGENLLTQLVAIEFESIYGVSHSAKSFMFDTAIFGGSNGYWRTSVLQSICFNPLMLTEDIDASIRTLLQGHRILHDRSITVTELAPTQLKSFWSQRKRWAQGWLEVSLKYQRRFWRSPHFNGPQKAFWTYLLYFREVFPLLAIQIFPIVLSALLYDGAISFANNWYLEFTTVVTLLSGIYQTVITRKVAFARLPLWYFIQYALLNFFFTALKNIISAIAIYDHLHGKTEWVVTPRDKQTKDLAAVATVPGPEKVAA